MTLKATIILIGGLIVAPALVVGSVVLLIDGSVPDMSDWRDVLGFAVNGGFSLIIWIIGAKVFRRTMREEPETSWILALIAKYQPILWLIGIGLGVFGAFGIIRSAHQTRTSLAHIYCGKVLEPSAPEYPGCLSIAMACDDEADDGPCGKIDSPSQADRCVETYKAAVQQLTDDQRAALPPMDGGDYRASMLNICLIQGSIPD